MKNIVIIFTLFICSQLFSYQWPSNKDNLDTFFGDTSGSDIQDGIKFSNNQQAVYPLTDGDIIFYQDSFEFGDLDYSGDEGNIMILSHKGDFRSCYRNFVPTEGVDKTTTILQTEMIGVSGKKGNNFIFSIYDEKKDEYINPQQLLPLLKDKLSPVIDAVYLKDNENYIEVNKDKRITSGSYKLYVDAYDVIKLNRVYKRFNPFSIFVFVDGFERYHVSFSSIKEIDWKLYFVGVENVLVENFLLDSKLLFGGDIFLTRGRSLIEVVVRDNNGNERSKSYSVLVE